MDEGIAAMALVEVMLIATMLPIVNNLIFEPIRPPHTQHSKTKTAKTTTKNQLLKSNYLTSKSIRKI